MLALRITKGLKVSAGSTLFGVHMWKCSSAIWLLEMTGLMWSRSVTGTSIGPLEERRRGLSRHRINFCNDLHGRCTKTSFHWSRLHSTVHLVFAYVNQTWQTSSFIRLPISVNLEHSSHPHFAISYCDSASNRVGCGPEQGNLLLQKVKACMVPFSVHSLKYHVHLISLSLWNISMVFIKSNKKIHDSKQRQSGLLPVFGYFSYIVTKIRKKIHYLTDYWSDEYISFTFLTAKPPSLTEATIISDNLLPVYCMGLDIDTTSFTISSQAVHWGREGRFLQPVAFLLPCWGFTGHFSFCFLLTEDTQPGKERLSLQVDACLGVNLIEHSETYF